MQAPNAQGLMGLMSQGRAPQGAPQQQAPVPSPMKASPMAGLGSVEDRVSAYRGNPAPLQQRYAMSQDLLDLLALQKIKSEKEAAARQMQLAMGQQQAAQGMEPQTIAQQREKEVHDLTKAELAQQRGETAQQQTADQQKNLQQVMAGGIARAPGAATAAQPKMMASGGIVAFAGTEGSSVEDERRKRREGESFSDYRRRMFDLDLQMQREKNAARDTEREAERQRRIAERGGEVIPPSPFLERPPLPTPGAAPAAPAPAAPVASGTPDLPVTPGPAAAAPRPAPAPAPAPRPAAAPAPAPAAAPGIAGLPAVAKPEGLEASLKQDYSRDPEAERKRLQEEIRGAYALTPEQRAVFDQGIAQRQKMFDESYDPEQQRRRQIAQALMGAGGRRYGEFAGAAQAGLAFEDQQRAQKLKDFESLQKSREGLIGLEREGIKPSIEGGLKALEQARIGRSEGQGRATSLYNVDVDARDKALNRQVELIKANISAEANRIAREGLDVSKAQSTYAAAMGRVQELERKLEADFAKTYGMLLMAEQGGKMEPAQKTQLETARAQLDLQKAQIRKELEPVLASARQKLGVTGGVSMTPEEKAAVERNANRGK